MITAGLQPREKTYEDLIEHLEKLESSFLDKTIPNKKESRDAPESISTTSILRKERPDKKPNVQFGKGAAKGDFARS